MTTESCDFVMQAFETEHGLPAVFEKPQYSTEITRLEPNEKDAEISLTFAAEIR